MGKYAIVIPYDQSFVRQKRSGIVLGIVGQALHKIVRFTHGKCIIFVNACDVIVLKFAASVLLLMIVDKC